MSTTTTPTRPDTPAHTSSAARTTPGPDPSCGTSSGTSSARSSSVLRFVAAPFLAGFACLLGVLATWAFFVGTARGQRVDEIAFRGATIGAWRVADKLLRLLLTVSVEAVAVIVLGVTCIALLRRRAALAIEAAVVVIGANLTTRLLKYHVFSRQNLLGDLPPDALGNWMNSLPSGHTTVAASAVIALTLVVPRRLRPFVAFAATVIGVLFGWATLVNQWHRPSDVVAGMLVSFGWGFAGLFLGRLRSALGGRRGTRHAASRLLPDTNAYRARRTSCVLAALGCSCLLVAVVAMGLTWNVSLQGGTRQQDFIAYAGSAVGLTGVMTAGAALFLWMSSAPSPAAVDPRPRS